MSRECQTIMVGKRVTIHITMEAEWAPGATFISPSRFCRLKGWSCRPSLKTLSRDGSSLEEPRRPENQHGNERSLCSSTEDCGLDAIKSAGQRVTLVTQGLMLSVSCRVVYWDGSSVAMPHCHQTLPKLLEWGVRGKLVRFSG